MEIERYSMIYNTKISNNNLRILGKKFINNNNNKCKLLIKNKKYNLIEFFQFKDFEEEEEIKIDLILTKNIFDKSSMFNDCKSLIKFSIHNLSENNGNCNFEDVIGQEGNLYKHFSIKNKNILFEQNSNESNYSHYSKILRKEETEEKFHKSTTSDLLNSLESKQKYYSNFKEMFYNCLSLSYISDLSLWNDINIISTSGMFGNCLSLKSLPDISRFDTNQTIYMTAMFTHCKSLLSFPDISKWNIINVIDISFMFYGCSSIYSLPD